MGTAGAAAGTGLIATLLGVAVTAGLHLWRRSGLFGVPGGTTAYVLVGI